MIPARRTPIRPGMPFSAGPGAGTLSRNEIIPLEIRTKNELKNEFFLN